MVYQNDKEFPVHFNKWACYFLCIMVMLHRMFPELGELTHDKALTFFKKEQENGVTDVAADMTIEAAQQVVDDYVGVGKVVYKGKALAPWVNLGNEWLISLWELGSTLHFVIDGNEPYDPWASGSKTRRLGKLIQYRVFEKVV